MTAYEERRIEMLRLVWDRPGWRRSSLVNSCVGIASPFDFESDPRHFEREKGAYRRALQWLEKQGLVRDQSLTRHRTSNRIGEYCVTVDGENFLKDRNVQG